MEIISLCTAQAMAQVQVMDMTYTTNQHQTAALVVVCKPSRKFQPVSRQAKQKKRRVYLAYILIHSMSL